MNKYEIEYLDEDHIYLCNGVIVPSVSQVLHLIFPDKYKNVDKKILNAKAKYGTELHNYIEQYENGLITQKLNYIQEASFRQYLKLKDKYDIKVLEQEKIVNYKDIYAGRFDMIANIGTDYCLCDIKTTADLDKEYLSWQLSLYEYASGKKFDKLYAIWLLKKDLGKLVEIERKTEEEIKELLKKVEELCITNI